MGTRNVTMVIDQQGVKKVAQYGQWDGYPSGLGVDLLKILRDKELFDKFKEKLPLVRFIEEEGRDKEWAESYNKNAPEWSSQPDLRTKEQAHWFSSYITRDLSAKVIINIANSDDKEIILQDREDSGKGEESWVEYCYAINLQDETFTVYTKLDREPLKVYSLNELPTDEDFIKELEGGDEDEV